MKLYRFFQAVLGGLLKCLLRVRVCNGEKEPEEGNYLVCANHTGALDVLVLAVALKRVQLHFMAKGELFRIPVLSSLFRALGAFPIDRKTSDIGAIKKTIGLLTDGESVGVFPQGTRCPYVDPRTTEVKNGVGMIAYRSGCDVLPIYIKTKKNRTGFFRRTECIIGDVIRNEDLGMTKGGTEEYAKASAMIFDRICTLGETYDA